VHAELARGRDVSTLPGMDDKKSGKDRLEDVPAWVRGDPEVLADWLGIDWDAEAKLFDELGGRQNQAVIGGLARKKA